MVWGDNRSIFSLYLAGHVWSTIVAAFSGPQRNDPSREINRPSSTLRSRFTPHKAAITALYTLTNNIEQLVVEKQLEVTTLG